MASSEGISASNAQIARSVLGVLAESVVGTVEWDSVMARCASVRGAPSRKKVSVVIYQLEKLGACRVVAVTRKRRDVVLTLLGRAWLEQRVLPAPWTPR